MPSYQKPLHSFYQCELCGGKVGVFDTRPHKNGSISRRRNCLECKNQIRTFEVKEEDYYRIFPKSIPMPKIQKPKKSKYVKKGRQPKAAPAIPEPPVTTAEGFQLTETAARLLASLKL